MCQMVPVQIGQSKVLLIDTPGFDDSKRSDTEILTEISRLLATQYKLVVTLKGIIYLHRITDNRFQGSAASGRLEGRILRTGLSAGGGCFVSRPTALAVL